MTREEHRPLPNYEPSRPLISPFDYTQVASCLDCGYALRDLPEPRCPECGRGFDPHDPRTMKVPGFKRPPRQFAFSLGESLLGIAFVAMFLVLLPSEEPAPWMAGFYLWGLIAFIWIIAWLEKRFGRSAAAQRADKPTWWRSGVMAMFIISIVLGVRISQCPHATRLFIGPIPIVLRGKPCNNGPHFRSFYSYLWFGFE